MNNLNEPLKLRSFTLKNRLVFPAMGTGTARGDGMVTDRTLRHYDRISAEGFGLVITETSFISPEGRGYEHQLSTASDRMIPGLRKLADVIHSNGACAVAQIVHSGSIAAEFITGEKSVAPSAVLENGQRVADRELTHADIDRIVMGFAEAASRVRDAGYDGVEIHSAHGVLLNQFLSPLANLRGDEYGGSLENRMRIHREILSDVRAAVGDDFTVFVRLGSIDEMPYGTVEGDAEEASAILEQNGTDVIDVSGGMDGYIRMSRIIEQGYYSDITERIKQRVSVPIMLTGGITKPEAAVKLLSDGKTDLIGVCRAAIADPEWARKALRI